MKKYLEIYFKKTGKVIEFCPSGKVGTPRVPPRPGKVRVHLENMEISWNFEKFNKNHGKVI